MSSVTKMKVNLTVLREVDSGFKELINTSKHVALYKFGSDDNQWEKAEVEGSFFVYQRKGDPKYGFLILNRLSSHNLMESVTKGMEFELACPFLLYRNNEGHISGIWFSEEEDFQRIAQTMLRLKAQMAERVKAKDKLAGEGDSSTAGGGFRRNSGKKEAMNMTATSGSNVKGKIPSEDSQPAVTASMSDGNNNTDNVAEFFARAASGDVMPKYSLPTLPHSPVMLLISPPAMPMNPVSHYQFSSNPHQGPANERSGNPLMAHLKLNRGVHSLATLEHQHLADNRSSPSSNSHLNDVVEASRDTQAQLQTMKNLEKPSESGRVQKCGPDFTLLSPTVFSQAKPRMTPEQPNLHGSDSKLEFLNESQFCQAFQQLMRTNPTFATKLHQAYVESIKAKLN